jgi:hypothetical protein
METEEKTYPEWEYIRPKLKECSFHGWVDIAEWRKTIDGTTINEIAEHRMAVPGGWLYQIRDSPRADFHPPVYVPSKYAPHVVASEARYAAAPHCQPTPAEGPPMTDEALRVWLTATYGEPVLADKWEPAGWDRWNMSDGGCVYMDTNDCPEGDGRLWTFGWQDTDEQLPAWVVGPALWAAHKHGVKP